ncbi:MAG: hypothetical protein DMD79_27230, partial [Candidatus Rokuibacteriota bacterium]
GPQTESGLNSYINYTRSYCYAAVKCLTDPDGPQNDGAFRPVRIEAPEGSFLNPRPPAGGGPRAVFCYRLFDAVIGALAPALPDRVTAAGSHFANPTFGGFDPRRNRRTVVYELVLSGTAARPDRDGCEAMSMAFNASNIPVEAQEANQPVLIERFELIRDSAGAGRHRGGTGIRRDLRLLMERGQLTNNTERHRFAPWGLFGGQPGQPGVTLINPGTPTERRVHSKASDTFECGDVISFQQSGAGGYGPPWEREPRAVLRDVVEDYVSLEGARRDYGVVIDPATLTVDEAATRAARETMRTPGRDSLISRPGHGTQPSPHREAAGGSGPERTRPRTSARSADPSGCSVGSGGRWRGASPACRQGRSRRVPRRERRRGGAATELPRGWRRPAGRRRRRRGRARSPRARAGGVAAPRRDTGRSGPAPGAAAGCPGGRSGARR